MTWTDYTLARQLLTEETVGASLRAAKAAEEALASRARKNLSGTR